MNLGKEIKQDVAKSISSFYSISIITFVEREVEITVTEHIKGNIQQSIWVRVFEVVQLHSQLVELTYKK